jgi:hypothetical protein
MISQTIIKLLLSKKEYSKEEEMESQKVVKIHMMCMEHTHETTSDTRYHEVIMDTIQPWIIGTTRNTTIPLPKSNSIL